MPEPTYLNDPEWIAIVISQPRIADALFNCMSIQPELDPDAGFGALQPIRMWLSNEFDENVLTIFDNPYKLYLFMRAHGLLLWNRDQLFDLIERRVPPNYVAMLKHVCRICKNFNAGLVVQHITENDHGNTPAHQR